MKRGGFGWSATLACGVVATCAAAVSACAIDDNDPIAGFGKPCVVADGQCDVEHVCVAASPGSADGHCAPVKSYGAACDAKKPVLHPAGQVGKDKDTPIDIKTSDDLGLIGDVRTDSATVQTFNQGTDNVDIADLCDFRDLQEVGAGFGVGDTNLVTSLDGLQSLTAVTGGLAIFDNTALTDISALSNLAFIAPRSFNARDVDVVIAGNPKLKDGDVDAFLTALTARVGRELHTIACNNEGRVCGPADQTLVAALIAGGLR